MLNLDYAPGPLPLDSLGPTDENCRFRQPEWESVLAGQRHDCLGSRLGEAYLAAELGNMRGNGQGRRENMGMRNRLGEAQGLRALLVGLLRITQHPQCPCQQR